MPFDDPAADLLNDLATLTESARAGVLVEQVPRLREGELRPATILYLDVVGFTALSQSLTPEQLAALIDRTFQLFELDIRRFGGHCDGVAGDAALYVFLGGPAYPPARESALRAGLALLDRLEQINASLALSGVSLGVRIGVSHGEVALQPMKVADRWTVMGDSVNLSQRLESVAEPGTIRTSWEVLSGAQDRFEWAGPILEELKGFGKIETYRVVAEKLRDVHLRGGQDLTPLIGRTEELDAILKRVRAWWDVKYPDATLDVAATGKRIPRRGRLLVLRGPAAVGKSRLAWEVVRRLEEEDDAVVVTANCLHSGGGIFRVGAELASLGGITAENLPERHAELVERAREAVSESYAERQREHLPALGLLLDSERVDTSGICQSDATQVELAVTLAIRSLCELAHHEAGRPVVLVIEDLQWLGTAETLLVELLANAALRNPLIVIATARPELEVSEALVDACEHLDMSVKRLGESKARDLLDSRLPGVELPEPLVRGLIEKADGIPYYLEEFTRVLVEQGFVDQEPGGMWRVARSVDEILVPDDVRSLVLGRLDQLPKSQRALTGRASVLGGGFSARLLVAIEARLNGEKEEDLAALLLKLIDVQVLAVEDGGRPAGLRAESAPTANRYFFRHVLTQETAYSALLEHNRRLLHSLAADCLAAIRPGGGAGEIEALEAEDHHLEHAGRHREALELTIARLSLMAELGRTGKWDVTWQHSLSLLDRIDWSSEAVLEGQLTIPSGEWEAPEGYDFIPSPPLSAADLLKAGMALELVSARCRLASISGRAEASMVAERALEHPVARTDAALSGRLRLTAGRYRRLMREYDAARTLIVAALENLRAAGDRLGAAECYYNLGGLHASDNEAFYEARKAYRAALDGFLDAGDRRWEIRTRHRLINVDRMAGHIQEGLVQLLDLIRDYRDLGDRLGETRGYTQAGMLAFELGRFEDAKAFLSRALEMHRELGSFGAESVPLNVLGHVAISKGRLEESEQNYAAALDGCRREERTEGEAVAVDGLARVARLLGRYDESRSYFADALRLERATGARRNEGITLHGLGALQLAMGDPAQARESFEAARDLLHDFGNERIEGAVLRDLSVVDRLDGEHAVALARIEKAEAMISPSGNQHELAMVNARLAQLLTEMGDLEEARTRLAAAEQLADDLELLDASEPRRLIDEARTLLDG